MASAAASWLLACGAWMAVSLTSGIRNMGPPPTEHPSPIGASHLGVHRSSSSSETSADEATKMMGLAAGGCSVGGTTLIWVEVVGISCLLCWVRTEAGSERDIMGRMLIVHQL